MVNENVMHYMPSHIVMQSSEMHIIVSTVSLFTNNMIEPLIEYLSNPNELGAFFSSEISLTEKRIYQVQPMTRKKTAIAKKKTAYTQIEKCNRLEVGKSDHFTRKCNEWLDMSFSSTFFSKSLPKFTVQSVEIKEISTHTHKMYHRILFMMFI